MLGILKPSARISRSSRHSTAAITCVTAIAAAASAGAPDEAQPPAEPPPPKYQTFRFDEDYSFLKDPARRTDFWDPIKYIPLSDSGDWHLSIGGEIRAKYEYYDNFRWNPDSPDNDGYFLQRYLLGADLTMGQSVRVFAQLQAGLENGRAGGPRGADEDQLDVHQAFVDLRLTPDSDHDTVTLRIGRQEMAYGSQRLISVRDSPNIRRAFDAGKVMTTFGDWHIDAFLARPVEDDPGIFDDSGDGETNFWGTYATGPAPLIPGGKIDLYYLGLRRPDADFVSGTANELRHSIGTRFFGKQGGLDYNAEGVFQWGSFGDRDIRAWTIGTDTGYTFDEALFTPRAGIRINAISGDSGEPGGNLGTFNAMFPKGAYFGEIALIGPANLVDIHPTVDLRVTEQLKVSADWDVFWRFSTGDGLYDNGGNVIRGAGGDGRFIGHQASLGLEWAVGRHTTINAVYSHFFVGEYLRTSGTAADVNYVGVWATYRF